MVRQSEDKLNRNVQTGGNNIHHNYLDSQTKGDLAKLIATFFYSAPQDPINQPFIESLLHLDDLIIWRDCILVVESCRILRHEISNQNLSYQFSLLFEGQGVMEAPPWGSVYLDSEQLLMGTSLVHYRQFLQEQNLYLMTGLNEPEDQFGLMLMAYAFLLQQNQLEAADKLMNKHLLTWAPDYLLRMKHNSISPFYQALASIAQQFLALIEY